MTDVPHYTVGEVETIDYIYDKLGADGGLEYVLGNILKYASRAKYKGQLRSDLTKIGNYAELALERLGPPEPEVVDAVIVPRVFNVGDPEPDDRDTIRLVGLSNPAKMPYGGRSWVELKFGQYGTTTTSDDRVSWWCVQGSLHHGHNTYASWEYWLEHYGPLTEVL